MANEVEVVVRGKDLSGPAFKSASQEAGKARRSFSDLGDSTDDVATKAGTATGAMGALASGVELSRLRAVRHAEGLQREADGLDKSAEAAKTKLDAMTKAAEADGKVTAAEAAQIKAQEQQVAQMEAAAKAAREKADAAEEAATQDNKLTIALLASGLAFDALSGVADVATLVMKAHVLTTVRSTISTVANKTATVAASAATKAWAAAQWLLNAAMSANPLVLAALAIAAIGAAIYIAYQRSETFRRVVDALWSAIKTGAKGAAGAILSLVDKWLGGLSMILGVMAKMPGKLGAPFRAARDAVEGARRKVRELKDELSGVQSKTVTVTVEVQRKSYDIGGGRRRLGVGYQASGGVTPAYAAGGGPRGSDVIVGEEGPELVNLPFGSRVRSNPDTRRLLGGSGGASTVSIEVSSGGSRLDDLLVELLRRAIRVRGGNVQAALGT